MKIAFGSDHAGFKLKTELIEFVKSKDYQALDFGAFSEDSVDYPDFALPAAEAVATGAADFGIVVCGSGIGVSIVCNKVSGIRAANCCSVKMAELARKHNNANVLNMGERLTDFETAKQMALKFIEEEFEGGRHMIRVEKIHNLTGC